MGHDPFDHDLHFLKGYRTEEATDVRTQQAAGLFGELVIAHDDCGKPVYRGPVKVPRVAIPFRRPILQPFAANLIRTTHASKMVRLEHPAKCADTESAFIAVV